MHAGIRWLGVVLVPLLLAPAVPAAAKTRFTGPELQKIAPVAVRDVPRAKAPKLKSDQDRVTAPSNAKLPDPGSFQADLVVKPTAKQAAIAGLDGDWLTGYKARVDILDQDTARKARQTGVVMRVGDGRGKVALRLNYAGFANAYGGDWGSRLRLVQLPECALTTPDSADCQATPLVSTNDTGSKTLSAKASPGMLVAATAAPSGSAGTYKASDLTPSSTWQAGGSTGGFSWSYPLGTPPVPGNLAPSLGLSYSSSSVDGKTVATNSQASWIGEGFNAWPGFIERRYKACADDGHANNGNQCWETDNATMSLNGSGGELLKDANGRWHTRNDDGSRIERLTGAANGAKDGEYWLVTTTDGTKYYFGHQSLSGANSTWTLPVAGNEVGEPCNGTTFATSFCTQAWRWNLDRVVDRNDNVVAYFYGQEKNYYAKNTDGTNVSEYVRGGWVDRIEYGLRSTSMTTPAPARVLFTPADRCSVAPCDPTVEANRKNWPDVPWDQSCTSATSCPQQLSPTFWTAKRLSKVTTQIRSGSSYSDVDSWVLNHIYRKTSDSNGVLWLDSIVRTGHTNGNLTMPPIRFDGAAMPNRADSLVDNVPPMYRYRVTNIFTETGGEIGIAYLGPDCVVGSRMPTGEDSNNLRCMPVRWQPSGYASPTLDWFHNYVVDTVTEHDRTAGALGAQRTYTRYEYVGDPMWHSDDDDGLVEAKNKSWAQFRGYGEVRVHKGEPAEEQVTSTRFLRGMHGDKLKNGTTRSVQVDGIDDLDHYAGMVRETIVYNGSAKVSSTVSDPWRSDPATATRTVNGSTVEVRFTGVSKQRTETVLDGGRGSRFATVRTAYDEYGLVKEVNDEGEEGKPGDEKCTLTRYARDVAVWLIRFSSTVEIVAKPCGSPATSDKDIISSGRTHYDNLAFGVAPTKGNITRQEIMSVWAADGVHSWIPTSRDAFDDYGRITKHTDALGNYVTSVYLHNADGLVSSTTIKNVLFQSTTTQIDPTRGLSVSEVEGNGKKTDLEYDALGRITSVWRPGRTKPNTPNFAFEYYLRADAPSAVVTKALNSQGGYIASYDLYDGLLRQRQTQNPSPGAGGGRVLSDVFYDTAGRPIRTFDKYHAAGTPGQSLVTTLRAADIERQTVTKYDGAGRVIQSVFQPKDLPKSWTTTGYGGDRNYVVPPDGGTATTTIVDFAGRTTELRQHLQRNTSSSFDSTTYTYTPRGDLKSVKDPLGNEWNYEVDLLGRVVRTTDPDQGVSTATYDNLNRRTSATDARGVKLVTTYDKLSRKTLLEQDVNGVKTKLSEWKYDTATNGKGRLASATRYVGAAAYSTTVTNYSDTGQGTDFKVSIPPVEGSLAGDYEFATTFNIDGSVASRYLPGVAGELSETLRYEYDALGNPTTLKGNLPDTPRYVASTNYLQYGEIQNVTLSTKDSNGFVWRSFTYETDTGRLATATTSRDSVSPNYVSINNFGYDEVGNLKSLSDSQSGDTQCFRYDNLRRMENAWTPASGGCTADPSTPNLGGPAPYWHEYKFDKLGNRTLETRHSASGDTKTAYTYGSAKPHFLTETKTTAPGVPDKTNSFAPNEVGSMKTRTVGGVGQTIEWDPEGHVSKVTEAGKISTYLYDADGNRLITRDGNGTTIYLGNGLELRKDAATGVLASTKYYSFASMTIAVRKAGTLTWLATDHHDTGELSISANTQVSVRRYSLPFGGSRGAAPSSWPTDKGFVGGTRDETGLTHLGAREYDPMTGRFISVDPLIDTADPQQMNGYIYSNNAPPTFSDANGQWWGSKAWNFVAKAATAVGTRYIDMLKWEAKLLYDNAGTIATVCGVLALFPVLTPVFGPLALGFGLLDTYKNCNKDFKSFDCGLGVVSLIPVGGRLISGQVRAGKAVKNAEKAVDDAEDAAAAAKTKFDASARPRSASKRDARSSAREEERAGLDQAVRDAHKKLKEEWLTPKNSRTVWTAADESAAVDNALIALFRWNATQVAAVPPVPGGPTSYTPQYLPGWPAYKPPTSGMSLGEAMLLTFQMEQSQAQSQATRNATMYEQKYAYMDKMFG